ncbi:MAG: ABC transporter ATP-binding protein/permease [Acidimicrobiia bacterium]|nr:ABC transporter ATP-binding protein/permease [Acidimicrobiia bacterium]
MSAGADGASPQDDDQHVLTTTGREARRGSFGPGGGAGMPTEKSDNFGVVIRRLGTILGKETHLLALVLVLTVASVALVVLGPRLLGQATDIIVSGVTGDGIDFGALHRKLFIVGAVYVASWMLGYAQAYILAGVVQRSMFALRESVERKINHLPLSYIDRQARGDLLSRVTNDIDNLSQSLQQTTSQILVSLLTLIGVITMMIIISPLLAVIALTTVPTSVWLMKQIGQRARPRFMDQWRHTGDLNAQAEEVFTGHSVVKSFGRQRDVEARFRDDNEQLYEASYTAQFTASLIQPMMVFMGNLQFVLIAVVGGLRISSGAMTVGEMQALIQYARQFSQPLTHLASMTATFQSGIASLERVLELLDAEEQSAEPPATVDPPPLRGRIVFDDVHFSYDPHTPLIEGLSVVAEPGQTVAIVGPTGAGKTTLVNLLMRFYDLDAGTITLDGRDIASMPRRELRSKIGMVLQDTWLFGGTIGDNLAYGNPDATDAQIREAARVTYVDRFVHSLPGGYDTVLNDEGDNISAGEKQLVTIARAFLADPSILILDEATSSVDTRTEVLIQEAMSALRSQRTSFVIAHRLSTIRGADVILVMHEGRIVEQGNHDDLLARGGHYADLYQAQFAGQTT